MIETKIIYYAGFVLLNLTFHIAQCTLMECKQRDYDFILLVSIWDEIFFWPMVQNFGCNIFFIWNLG